MGKTFVVINQKGGVLKTSSLLAISSILSVTKKPGTDKNFKVLTVDMDPQSSLTIAVGLEPLELDLTVVNALIQFGDKKISPIEDIIIPITDSFHIVPAVIDLSATETLLSGRLSRERILKKALASVKDNYDFIFIDCPPSLGILTINAMTAADYCIIPCSLQFLAFRGLLLLLDTIEDIKSSDLNPDLELFGVIATLNSRTTHSREILEKLQEQFQDKLIGIIPQTVEAQDAVYQGIKGYTKKKNKITAAYKEVVNKIIENAMEETQNE